MKNFCDLSACILAFEPLIYFTCRHAEIIAYNAGEEMRQSRLRKRANKAGLPRRRATISFDEANFSCPIDFPPVIGYNKTANSVISIESNYLR